MTSHLLAFLISASTFGSALAQQTTLEVDLSGIQHANGAVRVALYQDPKTFRKEAQAVAIQQVPAAPGSVKVKFTDLAPGRYAIMAYHDEDGDGELDRRLGMFPIEGYGLSNNPVVSGPPAFEDSAFSVGTDTPPIRITIRY